MMRSSIVNKNQSYHDLIGREIDSIEFMDSKYSIKMFTPAEVMSNDMSPLSLDEILQLRESSNILGRYAEDSHVIDRRISTLDALFLNSDKDLKIISALEFRGCVQDYEQLQLTIPYDPCYTLFIGKIIPGKTVENYDSKSSHSRDFFHEFWNYFVDEREINSLLIQIKNNEKTRNSSKIDDSRYMHIDILERYSSEMILPAFLGFLSVGSLSEKYDISVDDNLYTKKTYLFRE
jgi:hypothetical protein